MSTIDRRSFLLRGSALASGALFGVEGLIARGAHAAAPPPSKFTGGYGPLVAAKPVNTLDADLGVYQDRVLLALPDGFQYTAFGRTGKPMTDGRPTPGAHDGMATFAMGDKIHLVRNHELVTPAGGVQNGASPYDVLNGGGTTTLIVDPVTRLLEADYLSLSGTIRNCAGGTTPWGSWISCEETTVITANKRHGYNFEVPSARLGESSGAPVALTAMGRFSHEALAIDPGTGIVYQTEDANPGGFYRFLPDVPGDLGAGGALQMLAVKYRPQYDTRLGQTPGRRLLATWVTIPNPDPGAGETSVRVQGSNEGAAQFARLEGAWWGNGCVYFASTSGGNRGEGQIFEYRPLPSGEGYLTLIYESTDANTLNAPDNLCVSPSGALVLCEDGGGEEFLHGLTTRGEIFKFAKNMLPGQEGSELAGATFSPDGETLFFNIQAGMSFAIFPKPGRSWSEGAL